MMSGLALIAHCHLHLVLVYCSVSSDKQYAHGDVEDPVEKTTRHNDRQTAFHLYLQMVGLGRSRLHEGMVRTSSCVAL